MLSLHVTLSYYKRPEIQRAMVAQCRAKEVAVKYGSLSGADKGDRFGKRPDVLLYEKDVLSFAQKKATSFHVSEELWSNAMQLSTGLRRNELDRLRIGWDLVLDVDFPEWEATKRISQALVDQLRREGVPGGAITAKFSGNKGFHIAVPWEAFPDTLTTEDGDDLLVSDLFPDGVKSVAEYLVWRIDGPENGFALSESLVRDLDVPRAMRVSVCEDCGKKAPAADTSGRNQFVCQVCGWSEWRDDDYLECPKCAEQGRSSLLNPVRFSDDERVCACGSRRFRDKVDLAIDTMLMSSRHMYRLAYSLHEKSGLASVPVDPSLIASFDRSAAAPARVSTDIPFLDRGVEQGCAQVLLERGLAFQSPDATDKRDFSEVEWAGDAAPEEVFPPPIRLMLSGLKDGRKRALFVLVNFFRSVGWSYEMIEARLRDWNEANERVGGEGLRETEITGHLRYHKEKPLVLPPNFDNDNYYKDLGVLEHDELSRRVKNPVQYVRLRLKQRGPEE